MVERSLSMREAPGSIPGLSIFSNFWSRCSRLCAIFFLLSLLPPGSHSPCSCGSLPGLSSSSSLLLLSRSGGSKPLLVVRHRIDTTSMLAPVKIDPGRPRVTLLHHHGFYYNATPEATPKRPMARPPTPSPATARPPVHVLTIRQDMPRSRGCRIKQGGKPEVPIPVCKLESIKNNP